MFIRNLGRRSGAVRILRGIYGRYMPQRGENVERKDKAGEFKRGNVYESFEEAYKTAPGNETVRLKTAQARMKAQEVLKKVKKWR